MLRLEEEGGVEATRFPLLLPLRPSLCFGIKKLRVIHPQFLVM
jgi:hypothetical protein